MRLIRSRSGRSADSREFRKVSKPQDSIMTGNYMTLVSLAVLPLAVMALVSISTYISEHPLFFKQKRVPFKFDWGESVELRAHLAVKYNQGPYLPNGVPRRSGMSVAEFRDMWDGKWPIVLTDVVPSWGAYQWSKDFFYKFYSRSNLTVTQTKGSLKDASGNIISLGEFYKKTWEKTSPKSWIYATDEHFISNHPPLLRDIGSNRYAEEDYFQYFPEEIRPKNAMLLWGTKHSRSSLHVDPFNWTGTVAVLKGSKRWKMWPPDHENRLKFVEKPSGFPLNCPSRISNLDFFIPNPPQINLPGLGPQFNLEFDQKEGEILFIPTGWAHQALNLEETLAISSQYMNRNNYRSVLEEIIQCTDIDDKLPANYMTLNPEDQVKAVMSHIPERVLEQARETNSELRHQLMCGEDSES